MRAGRFPKPWTVNGSDSAFWVEAANGARFGFCYFKEPPDPTAGPAYLTLDEARRIASNIAKLPDLLERS